MAEATPRQLPASPAGKALKSVLSAAVQYTDPSTLGAA
jgi:hypothetical protein